jgi:hypothetical protein
MSTNRATGPFDVQLRPLGAYNNTDMTLGRLSLDKQFHGDLEAVSKGEMLSAGSDTKDSGGYVAIERVTGMLHGRSGSFVFQHSGTMTHGSPTLSVTVVPGTGTGALTGISGSCKIIIDGPKHSYDFEYTLPSGD